MAAAINCFIIEVLVLKNRLYKNDPIKTLDITVMLNRDGIKFRKDGTICFDKSHRAEIIGYK